MNFSAKNVNGIEKVTAISNLHNNSTKIVHTVPIKIPLKYKY
jgi:hypothetical protein